MSVLQISLNEANSRRFGELSQRTGLTPDELMNAVIEKVDESVLLATPPGELDWKAAWRRAAGMWKGRDDIPEFMEQLHREWNRVEPPEGPLE